MKRGRVKTPSSLHKQAFELVRAIYPSDAIIEEISLPIARGKTLFGDIYLPARKFLVEPHGEQHYSYSSFFYKSRRDFLLAQKRDRDKEEWCKLNDITYIELPFNKIDEWEAILKNA